MWIWWYSPRPVTSDSGDQAAFAAASRARSPQEAIVCAGDLIMPLAREHGVTIRPIDSEHSAIWQALLRTSFAPPQSVIILTASGGRFAPPADELARVTYEQALKHPNWSMGAKITIDSATLANKAGSDRGESPLRHAVDRIEW